MHDPDKDHGSHTLRVWNGTVVGLAGDDVFVELAPRMQGVISVRQFDEAPRPGDTFDFTLRGREEDLWVLALADERPLASWEDMEVGSLVAVVGVVTPFVAVNMFEGTKAMDKSLIDMARLPGSWQVVIRNWPSPHCTSRPSRVYARILPGSPVLSVFIMFAA